MNTGRVNRDAGLPGKRPTCSAPACGPTGPSRPQPAPVPDASPRDGELTADVRLDLDTCVAALVANAPPLTSGQRDTLSLILRGPHPKEAADMPTEARGPGYRGHGYRRLAVLPGMTCTSRLRRKGTACGSAGR